MRYSSSPATAKCLRNEPGDIKGNLLSSSLYYPHPSIILLSLSLKNHPAHPIQHLGKNDDDDDDDLCSMGKKEENGHDDMITHQHITNHKITVIIPS